MKIPFDQIYSLLVLEVKVVFYEEKIYDRPDQDHPKKAFFH